MALTASDGGAWGAAPGHRVRVISVVTLALLCVAATAVGAQGSRYQGFWGSFGLGGGLRLVSQDGSTESTGGGAALLRMGGKINDRILLAVETGGWGAQEDEIWVGRFNWTATGVVFPSATLGLFVKAGVGGATVRAVDYTGGTAGGAVNKVGFGTTVGLGYDIGFGSSVAVTPGFDFMYQWIGDPDVRDGALLLLTLGLTWH